MFNSGAAISTDVSGADAKIKLRIEILHWNGTMFRTRLSIEFIHGLLPQTESNIPLLRK